jgi:2-amino-4-hydroxy-6-hydroxymethyldihydropteridine diphosphokinase
MLHPVIAKAAKGRLPDWAVVTPEREQHAARVADLMDGWAQGLGVERQDRVRWRAAGHLHDSLRDADFDALRPLVDPAIRGVPGKLLHGPAAAARLRTDGVDDAPLLLAVAWHTLGHPDFDELGQALYLADYLEPGREYVSPELAALRDRVVEDMAAALRAVATERIGRMIRRGRPLVEPTVGFWNALVGA